MDLNQLAAALTALGCPQDKSSEMAAQLDKRARQLAAQKSRTYDDQDGDEATLRFQLKGARAMTKGIHFSAAEAIAE